jgi:hypothetical protein
LCNRIAVKIVLKTETVEKSLGREPEIFVVPAGAPA